MGGPTSGARAPRGLTRRTLLRLGAVTGGIAGAQLLLACSSSSPSPATAVPASSTNSQNPVPAATTEAVPTTAPKPTTAPAATSPGGSGGTHVVSGSFADAKNLNPVLESDTASLEIVDLLFSGLIAVTPPDGKVVGRLADEWNVSDDGLTYSFKLRKGIKFHDGTELTADDVKFTYDMILDKDVASPRRSSLLQAIAGPDSIVVTDPYTVTFTLKQTYAPFLVSHCARGILPKHLLADKKGADFNSADFNTKSPVGTGPYKLKEWVKDDHITVVANPDYFLGKPKIDNYIRKVVKDATVVAAQLKTGEIDFGTFEPSLLSTMQTVSHLEVKTYDTFNFTFFSYQLDPAKTTLFQDKAVRQALFYALDRKAMLDSILFGQGAVADSIFPLISWARDPQGNPQYSVDVDKAKSLLDGAGWKVGSDGIRAKDGKKLAFTMYTNSGSNVRAAYLSVLQEQWKAVGVQATPKTEEWTVFLSRITGSRDFEMFLIGFSWDVDPDESTMWTTAGQKGGFNENAYSNPSVDKLLDGALNTVDQAKRKQLYHQVDQLVLDDLPSPIMIFDKGLVAVNKRVKNLDPNAFNTRYNVEQWEVTDGK